MGQQTSSFRMPWAQDHSTQETVPATLLGVCRGVCISHGLTRNTYVSDTLCFPRTQYAGWVCLLYITSGREG